MNYGQIYNVDTANGPGMRISLFVSGCTHHCKGCFNQETWDFNYGKAFREEELRRLLTLLSPSYIQGLTILGGEPMEPENQETIARIIRAAKAAYPDKDIWIYSGYRFEQLLGLEQCRARCMYTDEILRLADILVDGEFILAEKDISLPFRGSRNQRIIDLAASMKKRTAVNSACEYI